MAQLIFSCDNCKKRNRCRHCGRVVQWLKCPDYEMGVKAKMQILGDPKHPDYKRVKRMEEQEWED